MMSLFELDEAKALATVLRMAGYDREGKLILMLVEEYELNKQLVDLGDVGYKQALDRVRQQERVAKHGKTTKEEKARAAMMDRAIAAAQRGKIKRFKKAHRKRRVMGEPENGDD